MMMRVCVTETATRQTVFLANFSHRQRVKGLSIGSGDNDQVQVPGLPPSAMKISVHGRHSFLACSDEHVADTTMKRAENGEFRVKDGSTIEAGGYRIEFAAASTAQAQVAEAAPAPDKSCFTKLFLTLVYEMARMERGAQAMLKEFDLPETDGGSEPFEKWVFAQLEATSRGESGLDDLIRGVRKRFERLGAMQLASYKTLQDCVERVREELDPSALFGKASTMERLFSNLGAWRRFQDAYNGAFASTQRFYNEYVYPTARTNLMRQMQERRHTAPLQAAS